MEMLRCLLRASVNADSANLLPDSSTPAPPIFVEISLRFVRPSNPAATKLYWSTLSALKPSLSFRTLGIAPLKNTTHGVVHTNLKYLRTRNPSQSKTILRAGAVQMYKERAVSACNPLRITTSSFDSFRTEIFKMPSCVSSFVHSGRLEKTQQHRDNSSL